MDLCGNMPSAWTTMHPDLEVLEASSGARILAATIPRTRSGAAPAAIASGGSAATTRSKARAATTRIDAGGQAGDKVSYGADN